MIIICHYTSKQKNSFLLCLHSLHTLFISLRVYSLLLDERHLGTEKCHRANFSHWHSSEGIQFLPNLTNIHWSSLGLFMVSWVKLGNEEHIKRGTRTSGQHKVLRKPMTKAAPHSGSSVMFSTAIWSISPWCTVLCADLFLSYLPVVCQAAKGLDHCASGLHQSTEVWTISNLFWAYLAAQCYVVQVTSIFHEGSSLRESEVRRSA